MVLRSYRRVNIPRAGGGWGNAGEDRSGQGGMIGPGMVAESVVISYLPLPFQAA